MHMRSITRETVKNKEEYNLGVRERNLVTSWISYNITFYILPIECPLYTIYDLLILLYNITLRVSDYWATFLSPHILPNMSGNSHCESYHWEFIFRKCHDCSSDCSSSHSSVMTHSSVMSWLTLHSSLDQKPLRGIVQSLNFVLPSRVDE